MAPRSTPFNIVCHFTGKKSNSQILNDVHRFYIDQVKVMLVESNLEGFEKQEVIDRLLDIYTSSTEKNI